MRRALCGAIACAWPAVSFGQEAPGADQSATGSLDTVVVTAQMRSENAQNVPLSVAAFDGEQLFREGVSDAMQLQAVVPSLTYNATGDSAQPYLRGIGTRLAPIGLEPSIATYIDDRYVPRPFGAMFNMLDVERVEVLKGPQGTLYGRNAAGGAIRALTKDPPAEAEISLTAKLGDYSYEALGVSAGGPLSSSLRGRLTAGVEQRDGFATNLVPSGRRQADDLDLRVYRGKLLWDASDTVTAKLAVSWWQRTDWNGRDFMAAGLPEANRGGALYGAITSRQRDEFASALKSDNDLREAAADLRFDVRLDGLDFVSITTFTDDNFVQSFDVDASSATLLDDVITEPSKTWSQEFRLLSDRPGPLSWLAGLFYYHQNGSNLFVFPDSVSLQPAYPAGTDLTNGLQTADSVAYAAFGDASYAFDAAWSLSFGGRWSREEKSVTLAGIPDAVLNVPTPFGTTPFAAGKSWNQFTPQVSLQLRGALGLAYFTYARGFKSGGYNYPASIGSVLDPETVDSYELGLKSDLLHKRLRIDAALFFYDVKDLQVTRGGAGAFLATENAANATVRGAELDFAFAVSPTFTVTGGFALNHSEYTAYVAGVLVPQLVPPYGSVPLPGGLDVRGEPLLRSPETAANVAVHYEPALARGSHLALTANYSYKDSYYFDFSAVPATEWLKQPATGLLNARIAYVAARGGWEVGLWGTNLTDRAYYDDAVLNSVSSRVSYADPRLYGVDFKVNLR